MAVAMFVINSGEGACPSYYAYNYRFDTLSASLPFRLPDNILDEIK